MADRRAIVTGGTRGIGRAISTALKEAGYAVAATYAGNDEAAHKFREETGVAVYKWDVGDYEACKAGVAEIEQAQGPTDVLVNNAGVTRDAMFHKMTPQQWREVIRADLNSVFNMTHQVFPGMRERGYGRIVNISSINGQKGQMGQTNYSAAKAGMLGFTRALAQEGAFKGVTVNAVAPGYIATDMVAAVPEEALKKIVAQIPVGRLGEAEEIARCVLFLASEDAGFITGSVLTVNGGQYFAA
ncbi:acetoacetyl-CoA reductase [Amphiplicatus metriothermophilus]|uniref:3-oxoacyl-[acyl-carrier-protein] reductase n=1 Tax=Amphiplicatus metriothermophilus TaxID=1519374 RepID=A0A239PK84_9PROT|nr:acetoacetyl-CoA reductase [Amphiplicatus metriothermophilus]MBB5517928.1 acetoacetyl-CoA reductase [Amphiplicatus metriothermophilus]SNT67739.1 3-oxoacyl-[acyl-carrier-protein] reductase [Amphiplicatus metriothermophilus]